MPSIIQNNILAVCHQVLLLFVFTSADLKGVCYLFKHNKNQYQFTLFDK